MQPRSSEGVIDREGFSSSGESDYDSDISEEEASNLDGLIQNAFPFLGQLSPEQSVELTPENSNSVRNQGLAAINFPQDISRRICLPNNFKAVDKIIPIHNRAVKAFDTLLARIKRAVELTRITVDDCAKDLKMLDLDRHPECCRIRTRFISVMKEALLQAQTRGTFFEEISIFIENEIKRIVNDYFPQNVDDFVYTHIRRIKGKKPMWFPLEPMYCLLCVDRVADCRIVPSEGDNNCSCKEMAVCVECMLRHYWENSDYNRKSYAVCPQCRGEFTLQSLIYVKYEPISLVSSRMTREASPTPSLVIPRSITISKKNMRRMARQHPSLIHPASQPARSSPQTSRQQGEDNS